MRRVATEPAPPRPRRPRLPAAPIVLRSLRCLPTPTQQRRRQHRTRRGRNKALSEPQEPRFGGVSCAACQPLCPVLGRMRCSAGLPARERNRLPSRMRQTEGIRSRCRRSVDCWGRSCWWRGSPANSAAQPRSRPAKRPGSRLTAGPGDAFSPHARLVSHLSAPAIACLSPFRFQALPSRGRRNIARFGFTWNDAISLGIPGAAGTIGNWMCCRDGRIWRLVMGRGLLLWLIGIPLPIILLVWLFGGLS
jgi:hypothetical protein